MSRALETWAATMRAEGIRERTISERVRIVAQAARQLDEEPTALTRESIVAWLGDLPSAGTRASYFGAIRAWSRWLRDEQIRADDPTARLKTPRVPRRLPRPISREHLEDLLNKSGVHLRARVMIHLAAYEGLRVHEIAAVRGEDVDLLGRRLFVRGKGGVEAWLPLHETVAADALLMPRRGWWFESYSYKDRAGEHILPGSVTSAIGRALTRCEIRATAHQLRHFFGTELLRSGVDVRVVQELMRHASLSSTQIYTLVVDDQERAGLAKLRPVHEQPRSTIEGRKAA